MILDLFTGEEDFFRRQNISSSFGHLCTTLAAFAAAAACRRKEDIPALQRAEQCTANRRFDFFFSVYRHLYIARRHKLGFRSQQQHDQQQHDDQKDYHTRPDGQS